MAGLGECCSHIGAILYTVEFVTNQKDKVNMKELWKIIGYKGWKINGTVKVSDGSGGDQEAYGRDERDC